ncbi:MAG: hypothetical protein NDI61_07725 [Bdellovibrionaceae bacterium]|nr:hypothetical protein [Pseudobdellovibrionaceae bacterium]
MGLNRNFRTLVLAFAAIAQLTGCTGANPSFSLLADENTFNQTPTVTTGKIDILWVIDNSGSMASSQQNVADNFSTFIELFNAKNMDYRMAVTTSEAYRAIWQSQEYARLRDGTDATGHTGVYVIDPSTPDLQQTFLTNMLQGVSGTGDERVFQSFKQALTNSINLPYGFPRQDAFLSVIIVSDEDDFSHDAQASISGQYSNVGLHTTQSYVDFLDQLTLSTSGARSYNVNTISILDQTCLDTLNASFPGRRIGVRYQELATATNGIIGSLCGDFAATLADISNRILELTTAFYLNREPNPESIVVLINGAQIPNDPVNGWQYNASNNSITFHGTAVPAAGSQITVRFDPASIK